MRVLTWLNGWGPVVFLAGILFACDGRVAAAERDPLPVARAIDQEIRHRLDAEKVKPSGPADDAEFLRRVTLDITGRVPTLERAAAFLDSAVPDKRRQLIDELLASPLYGEYLARTWTNLILASGTPPRSMQTSFQLWLAGEFNQGRGWDQIVHEMLTATGTPAESPASYFVRANLREPGQLAGTTAQFFLGVRMQCAECHRHPFAPWKQEDYWGLAVFFSRLRQVNVKGGQQISEAPPASKKPAGPILTIPATGGNKGAGKVVLAKFLTGAPPALSDEGPFRPALAAWVTAKDNPFFAAAAVNRTWGHFFGSGFVNPVDDFNDDLAPPSHPALLKLLAEEFIASGHDLKHLIRCLCNSAAYQRTSWPLPENKDDEKLFSHMAVKVLGPDALFDSLVLALGNPKLPGGLGSPLPYEVYAGKPPGATRPQLREEFLKFFDTKDDSGKATEYTHGIPQVLALLNARQFNAAPPIVDKLIKSGVSQEKAIEALFLAALSRRPTADEVRPMTTYLGKQKDARQGYAGILWILFNSSEFVLNR